MLERALLDVVYSLRSPAPELSRFIDNYWFVGAAAPEPSSLRVNVFVDARADLIFNFGAAYDRAIIGGPSVEIASSNLDAQRLVPIRITQCGLVRTTGVRFRLGGLGAFARIRLHDITGATPTPSEVLGQGAESLERAIQDAFDEDSQARLLDQFFLAQLRLSEPYEGFGRALQHAIESRGAAALEALSDAAGVSPRQIERLFARFLGLSPRAINRVLRFQTAIQMLMRDPGCTLAEVAAAAGYFDQAHFVRDFKAMTGGVPRGYRGYFPPEGPADFAPNVVAFIQDAEP